MAAAGPEERPEPERGLARAARRLLPDAGALLLAEVATAVALFVVLRLRNWSPRVPLDYGSSDSNLVLMAIKNIVTEGWIVGSDALGMPFGQKLYDYPAAVGDTWNILGVRLLALGTSDPVLILNVFYLLGYLAVTATMFVSLRLLRISAPLAVAGALAYAFLPYHLLRGPVHLFLSGYYAVPLACVLVIRQWGPEPWFDLRRRGETGPLVRWRWASAGAVLVAVLIAGTGMYYAIFTLVALATTGLVRAVSARRLGTLVASGFLGAIVVGILGLSAMPSILYARTHGPNDAAGQRAYAETEFYGLRIVNLVMPVGGHRVDALADLKAAVTSPIPGEGSETLGLIGAGGYLGLLAMALRRVARGDDPAEHEPPARADGPRPVPQDFGKLAGLALLFTVAGTIAGLWSVIAAMGFTQLRAWNRSSVFVAFCAIAAAVAWVDRWTWSRRGVQVGLSAALVVLALFDQTTPHMVPAYETTARGWKVDRAFGAAVERHFPSADVFQLPYVPFPENPPVQRMSDYDHFRGYLHTEGLRWSYGAVKGREVQWQPELLATEPPAVVVERVAAAGFEALWFDRFGHADGGASFEAAIRPIVGEPVVVGPGERVALYDLRPLARRLVTVVGQQKADRIGFLTTHPLFPTFASGASGPETGEIGSWRWMERRSTIEIAGYDQRARDVVLSFDLDRPAAPPATVEVRVGRRSWTLEVRDAVTHYELPVTVGPGATVELSTDAPPVRINADPRDLRYRVLNFSILEPELPRGTSYVANVGVAPAA